MPVKIIMPAGGQNTSESVIVKWHKSIGDMVSKGEVLFGIETDKAVMDIESFADGMLLDILYSEGESVKSGEVVAYIGDKEEKLPTDSSVQESRQNTEYQYVLDNISYDKEQFNASPAARKLARDSGISLKDIAKTMTSQTIKRKHVEQYIDSCKKDKEEQVYCNKETTSMRRTIAMRMTESASVIPQYSISIDVDMDQAMKFRKSINNYYCEDEVKVSYNDIIIKCTAKAIEKHPIINSSYNDKEIKLYKDVNFGIAVKVENALVVPVVRAADKKTIYEIAIENAEHISNARSGMLKSSDMSDGTITLSNLGMYGVNSFTALINPPESCIMAVGSIIEKPVIKDGKILIANIMNITASFDHRTIDGAAGAAFLRDVRVLLENPQLAMI